ncbi:MAG: BrxA/BrxB family bacilliredoxin [Flavobacteriales bacterium TMED191]|nr:MAG: BrxA/BrxB family bacilliredoxin [Flavobacteriales bacterium TMED191]|tara:strand:- start:2346 stop:2762 length:417 start_codon:yes stop_codon:yes gene_type:complete
MYPEELCKPMREELTSSGFNELTTSEEVDELFNNKNQTFLIFINSVCGCAAGSARPGVILSTQNAIRPDKFTTVFAGQDKEATQRAREYMDPYPPSSPSIALFKNGEIVHFIERHEIEGNLKHVIAENLINAFNLHCQ